MLPKIRVILCGLFPVIGTVCMIFPDRVMFCLPYLLGGAMALTGLVRCVLYLMDQRYLDEEPSAFVQGSILLIMGSAFMLQGSNSLGPMGTTWAIIGIRKAARSLTQALQKLHWKEHFIRPLLLFILRMTLALLLLFDPFEKFSTHIVILGLELTAVSLRFTLRPPPAWKD